MTLPQVESSSRAGEYVYENIHTDERQAWFPTEPAVQVDAKVRGWALDCVPQLQYGCCHGCGDCLCSQVYDKEPVAVPEGNLTADAKERNRLALAARKAKKDGFLPDGWRRVRGTRDMHHENTTCWSRTLLIPWWQVPSNSRPGEFVYENIHTDERVAWYPVEAALKQGAKLDAAWELDTWQALTMAGALQPCPSSSW